MIWNTAARKLGLLIRRANVRQDSQTATSNPLQVEPLTRDASDDGDMPLATVRKLRRRLLSRKGTRMLVSMVERQDRGTLSILDANGVVVYWHDGMRGKKVDARDILDRHVAQFYAPKKIAQSLARSHLCRAFAQGSTAEFGWRRRSDGTVFWGVTVIEPLFLKDGRLQGFTHITRAVNEPRVAAESPEQRPSPQWSDAGLLPRADTFARVARASDWRRHTPMRSRLQRPPQFALA